MRTLALCLRTSLALALLGVVAWCAGGSPSLPGPSARAYSTGARADSPSARADSAARTAFDAGVQAYRAGEWDQAHRLWLDALAADTPAVSAGDPVPAQELDHATLCYDLGNAAWRLDRKLEAVAWFTASVRLAPRDADAWANLEFVRGKSDLPPADRGDLSATLDRLVSSLDLAESEWLVLIMALALAGAVSFWAVRGGSFARRTVAVVLVLAVASLPPWIHSLRQARRDDVMVVEQGGVQAWSEPRRNAALLARLEPAAVVERLDDLPGWVKVELSDGRAAWVEESGLFPLAR